MRSILIAPCCWLLLSSLTLAAEPKTEATKEPTASTSGTVDARSAIAYILSCRKPNGAFGPRDQEYTDAAWNYPAVRALTLLNHKLEAPEKVLAHGLGYPFGHAGASHWLFYHQAMLEKLLDSGKQQIGPPVKLVLQDKEDSYGYYGSPLGREADLLFKLDANDFRRQCRAADELGFYNLSSLYLTLAALEAQGRKASNPSELIAYIQQRQSPSGGFADRRDAKRSIANEEAQVAKTWQAIAGLKLLGAEIPHAERCVEFLHSCQSSAGGFRAKTNADEPGNSVDVYYTWAALQAFSSLKSSPPHADACADWINGLQNADGGFGDQPGWRSRLYSTYFAVDALSLLSPDGQPQILSKQVPQRTVEIIPEGKFQIYQGLNKTPVCTPEDLAGLAARKLNLLGLKSADFDLAAELQAACLKQKLPMDVVLCLEAYPHRTVRESDITLHHVANITLDPRWNADQKRLWETADAAGKAGLPWSKYQAEVIEPLQQLGALTYPEQDYEMDYAYAAYDAGLAGPSGYQAVLAGFNWAPRDFVRVFPWRERYVDKLTPMADCDAHGDLTKWSPQLDYTRHLYLATGPSQAEFLEAAAAGRVVCAIKDPAGVPSGVTLYGKPAAVDYMRRHLDQWRWWPPDDAP